MSLALVSVKGEEERDHMTLLCHLAVIVGIAVQVLHRLAEIVQKSAYCHVENSKLKRKESIQKLKNLIILGIQKGLFLKVTKS